MKGAIVALAMLSGVSHGFVAPNSASSPRAAKASASSAARNNYYNTLSQAEKLDQLARCRFMDRSEFDDGIAAIAGKKCVIIGCGAQGLNQGLNMRDSGCDVSYALRQVAIDEKRAGAADNFTPAIGPLSRRAAALAVTTAGEGAPRLLTG